MGLFDRGVCKQFLLPVPEQLLPAPGGGMVDSSVARGHVMLLPIFGAGYYTGAAVAALNAVPIPQTIPPVGMTKSKQRWPVRAPSRDYRQEW